MTSYICPDRCTCHRHIREEQLKKLRGEVEKRKKEMEEILKDCEKPCLFLGYGCLGIEKCIIVRREANSHKDVEIQNEEIDMNCIRHGRLIVAYIKRRDEEKNYCIDCIEELEKQIEELSARRCDNKKCSFCDYLH